MHPFIHSLNYPTLTEHLRLILYDLFEELLRVQLVDITALGGLESQKESGT